MELTPEITVAFTGNRQIVAPNSYHTFDIENDIRKELRMLLSKCYDDGKRIFLSGGAVGFDLIAAEEVIAFRNSHLDVQLFFVVPFLGQEAKYSESEKEHYRELLAQSNQVVTISAEYNISAYHLRNDYLITHSSLLIAYSNRMGRGTASTIKRATKRGKEVVNIYDLLADVNAEEQLTFDF